MFHSDSDVRILLHRIKDSTTALLKTIELSLEKSPFNSAPEKYTLKVFHLHVNLVINTSRLAVSTLWIDNKL